MYIINGFRSANLNIFIYNIIYINTALTESSSFIIILVLHNTHNFTDFYTCELFQKKKKTCHDDIHD